MSSKAKYPSNFFRTLLTLIVASLVIASIATSFMYYKLSSFLLHKRNLKQIEVSLDSKDFPHEEIEFKSKIDSTTLKGVFFPSKYKSNKTIIIIHGFNQNRMMGGRTNTIVEYFVPKGYNVLAFDLRGGGRSDGNLITFGYYEKYDVMGAVDFLKQRGKEGEKIALLGFSMGAATAIEAAEKDARIDAVIADSPFRDLRLFVTKDLVKLSNNLSAVPEGLEDIPYWTILQYLPLKDKIFDITAKLCGIEIDEVSPMNAVKSLSAKPVFLIHGKDDELIPYTNSQFIYDSLEDNPNNKLWLTEKAGHIKSLDMYQQQYLDYIKAFLDKNISTASSVSLDSPLYYHPPYRNYTG